MFEDALWESSGRARTQRGWLSGIAAVCNGSILCLLLFWPLLHPASLPKQTLSMLLAAPAPPAPPTPAPAARLQSSVSRGAFLNPLTPPQIIPNKVAAEDRASPPEMNDSVLSSSATNSVLDGLAHSLGTVPSPQVSVAKPKRLAISSGVMAGLKTSGAVPRYPAIAMAARVQGTVVLAAKISRSGAIEDAHVVSGPAMLAAAALDAVETWRYRPYLLNGQPVEVETTIQVIFHLAQ